MIVATISKPAVTPDSQHSDAEMEELQGLLQQALASPFHRHTQLKVLKQEVERLRLARVGRG